MMSAATNVGHLKLVRAKVQSENHIMTDGRSVSQSVSQSVCLSWCRAPDCLTVTLLSLGSAPSLTREGVCRVSESVDSVDSCTSTLRESAMRSPCLHLDGKVAEALQMEHFLGLGCSR
jgi:hypothetical protein